MSAAVCILGYLFDGTLMPLVEILGIASEVDANDNAEDLDHKRLSDALADGLLRCR